MQIFTDEQLNTPVSELAVRDTMVVLQTIARLCTTGAIRDTELETLGQLRNRMTNAIFDATGINYDEAVAKAAVEAQKAQQTTQQ